MFIKNLDYLSPRVTLYHKGLLTHSSILSGIISIISILLIIVIAIYFLLGIINRENPNAFYYRSFIEDAGNINVNTSSLFHFLHITRNIKGKVENEEFDFTAFNIIGVSFYVENFLGGLKSKLGIYSHDHWLYGYCDKNKNTEGLDDLMKYDFFEKSACISKFFNHTEKKYYEIGDPNFVWPSIAHGTFNENNRLYGLYILKCNNITVKNTLGDNYYCKSDEEIEEYLNVTGSRLIHLYFINNYVNLLDYNHPIKRFFYRIETPLDADQYTINDININPTHIRSHNDLILNYLNDDISYMFDRNDAYINNIDNNNLYLGYIFFLKNIINYYERTYKKIQEVISNIGGVYQVITIISIYINHFYNNYIVLNDTEILLHSTIGLEKSIHRSKSLRYMKKSEENMKIKKDDKKSQSLKTTERKTILLDKRKNEEINNDSIFKNNNNASKSNNIFIYNIGENQNEQNIIPKIEKNNFIKSADLVEKKNLINNNDKNKKNFLSYFCSKSSCCKKNMGFEVYENFRIKIISEEHIVKSHLNIYNLMKVTERKRYSRKNNYQLGDVINFA